jgi:hypothetical protein
MFGAACSSSGMNKQVGVLELMHSAFCIAAASLFDASVISQPRRVWKP